MNGKANPNEVALNFCFTQEEAWLIAQLLKRLAFADYAGCAVDQIEAYDMMYACEKMRRQLSVQGFAPR